MESPHLYDSVEYKKGNYANLKQKVGGYSDVGDYSDLNGELATSEISLDLHNLIDDPQQHFVNEYLIAELQGLNVDKNSMGINSCPRGIGANPGIPTTSGANNLYNNTLPYVPQPVHGSQFDRQYERQPIKEEPNEATHDTHEYPPCARMNYGGYGSSIGAYPVTPTMVPGADHSLLKSPMKSPGVLKSIKSPKSEKNTDEYRRRRERNNIAVRKSREKAKLRSRETEERVKNLSDDNRKLQEQCKVLSDEIGMLRSMFSTLDFHRLPEPYKSDMKSRIEVINMQFPQHHQHLPGI